MINLRMRKVLRDLTTNKSRTALVVLAIAVGVFALSVTFRTQALLSELMVRQYRMIDPAEVTLSSGPFTSDFVNAIRRAPGVDAAEGQNRFQVRVRVGDEWRQLILVAVDNPQNRQVNRLAAEAGPWPPPKRSLAIERSFVDSVGGQIGVPLQIETADHRVHDMPLTSSVHDLTAVSGHLGDNVLFGYVTMDTLEWLGQPRSFNELQLVVDGDPFDTAHVRQVAEMARRRLEDETGVVFSTRIRQPDRPETYNIIASILLMLAALGILSLVLSAFLVINTISGLLARQVPQIGVLKAVGARQGDILGMYLMAVLAFALLALFVAIPLGILGAQALSSVLAYLLNYNFEAESMPPYVIAVEIGAAILVPLLAALYPIRAGTNITVRQAISGVGAEHFGGGVLDRLTEHISGLPATLLYAMRNMLRRKGRLALTLLALALGGAIVIGVLSVRASLFSTLDQITDYWRQDVTVTFDSPERREQIAQAILSVPGVTDLEYQLALTGVRKRPDGSESDESSAIFGVPPDSVMLHPTVVDGRWLSSADDRTIVVNVDFHKHEPDVGVGNDITLSVNGHKSNWHIVGVVTSQLIGLGAPKPGQPMVYAPYKSLAAATRNEGLANRAAIQTGQHDEASQAETARSVEKSLSSARLSGIIQTRTALRGIIGGLFSIIVLLLVVMALLFTLVGGLSLSGAMSLNVLERTREIGVLRAIGASNSVVTRVILTEGIWIGLASWLLAALLSIPLSLALDHLIGLQMLSWPLIFSFPPSAILIWLIAVIVLAAIASYLPARGATRITVRDVLSEE
ncbi:MAG: ABC transporter permease [Anaerolineae bacterium]